MKFWSWAWDDPYDIVRESGLFVFCLWAWLVVGHTLALFRHTHILIPVDVVPGTRTVCGNLSSASPPAQPHPSTPVPGTRYRTQVLSIHVILIGKPFCWWNLKIKISPKLGFAVEEELRREEGKGRGRGREEPFFWSAVVWLCCAVCLCCACAVPYCTCK
jgi:hypothetical protein